MAKKVKTTQQKLNSKFFKQIFNEISLLELLFLSILVENIRTQKVPMTFETKALLEPLLTMDEPGAIAADTEGTVAAVAVVCC